MKRSKILLVANILSTIYSVYLLCTFVGAIIEAGGTDFIDGVEAYFELAFDVFGMNSPTTIFLYVILVLLCVHIIAFTLQSILILCMFIFSATDTIFKN